MNQRSYFTHLDALESEAIHIMREVAAECTNPVLLFSGGKDSVVLLRLAEKAFRPSRFPFPLMHIDTGHNFPEVIEFRDYRAKELGERLIVRSMEDSIQRGRVVLRSGNQSRNPFSRLHCWMQSRNSDLMPVLAVLAEMKKKHGLRSVFSHSVMNSVSGIQRISVRNYGVSTIPGHTRGRTSGFSRSVTGRSWIYGNISGGSSLKFHQFILHTKEK